MSEAPESMLLVPLRSNAHGILAGAPVEAIRRRLKFASVAFDHILLEAGVLRVHAGPTGSSAFVTFDATDQPRFQSSRERAAAQQQGFSIAIGEQSSSGVPAETMRSLVQSESTIAWAASLEPFASELPASCSWIEFVRTIDPTGEAAAAQRLWMRVDERNPALRDALPVQFVRNAVVKHANRDLAVASFSGVAVMQDRLHQQVTARRFEDDNGWRGAGFAMPILFPMVGELPWEDLVALRGASQMRSFRAVMREVEAEALTEAAGGDVEAAAHHVYERYLARAVGHVEGLGAVVRRGIVGLTLGGVTGIATAGLTGPVGIVAGAALGTGVTAVGDLRTFLRTRRQRGWVAIHNRLIA